MQPAASGAVPDYMLDQNAVLHDKVAWRHGSVPDYSMANAAFENGMQAPDEYVPPVNACA